MKPLLSLLLVLGLPGLLPLHAADWRDTLTPAAGKFPALRSLTARYAIRWSGLKAAETEVKFDRTKSGLLQLGIEGRTIGAARVLWRLDSEAVSTCSASTLRPVKLRQTEAYAKKTLTTTVNFTAEGPQTLRVPNPPDPTPPKVKKFKFPHVYDLPSGLLFIRSQPLRQGQTTRLCVFPASSPYYGEVTVTGREKIKAAGREWNAIRCDLRLQSVQKDFSLVPHQNFKKATAWVSDDNDRLLLRLEAEIFVGRVRVELEDVTFAK